MSRQNAPNFALIVSNGDNPQVSVQEPGSTTTLQHTEVSTNPRQLEIDDPRVILFVGAFAVFAVGASILRSRGH